MAIKKIENYLDTGSLNLFAQQIRDTLENVISVAIHDAEGHLVWAGPHEDARDSWTVAPFVREPVPGVGFCERLSNDNFVYVFYLRDDGSKQSMATVSIQVGASHPLSLEFAHAEVVEIIQCIERQLQINSELSSIRRMSDEGRRGLDLLVKLDELGENADASSGVRRILELSAAHFDVEMAAVVLPELGIQDTFPASLLAQDATSKAVMTTLGSLVTQAKMHRKVLLSDANLKIRIVGGFTSRNPRVLCCPIINSKDDVVGIFVLIGPGRFSRDHVRLARAICVKIYSLVRTASRPEKRELSRHAMLQHIDKALQFGPQQSHALVYVDIDKLHVVNDNYGHVAGDEVIAHVLRVINEFAREDDALSHLSGDCFALFLHGVNEETATDRAGLILETLARQPACYENVDIEVSISVGIVLVPRVATNASAALNTAEIAARSAKSRGGGRYVVFQDADASVAQRRTDLDQVNELQFALMQNQFVLHAQPIVSLHDDEGPARYEILTRLLGPASKSVSSATFISSAERYQMMSAIDRWVIRTTLDQLAAAGNQVEVNLSRFGINISAQSLADDDFCDFVETCVAESGISPDSLCFEITETTVMKNLERAQRFIHRLRKLGCMVALDDFGTGYCSFAYLKDLPVHYVKIDGVFVRDILQDSLSQTIVSSMVEIAQVMKAATVAEHVENELIYQQMRNYGIDFVQGFFTGRPVPLATVLAQLDEPLLPDTGNVDSSASA